MAFIQTFERGELYHVRSSVAAHAVELGASEQQVAHLTLIVSELVTNAVTYGGGSGGLRVWSDGEFVFCEISDHGPGIAEPQRAGMTSPPAWAQGGRGLWVCRRLASSFDLVTSPKGTTITVGLSLRTAADLGLREPR